MNTNINKNIETVTTVKEESAITDAVKKVSPAVVSIVATKDVPVIEQYWSDSFFFPFSFLEQRQNGTEKKEVSSGTGFVITSNI